MLSFNINYSCRFCKKTGLSEECIFNDIPNFHVTENSSVDLMHDGAESFMATEIVKYYITKTDYFNLEELNNIIESFDYSPYCGNIPLFISENNI